MSRYEESEVYSAATSYLYSRINYEHQPVIPYQDNVLKLERMERLVAELGNPHLQVPVVHVAGSKGKGSTSSMIASILSHSGWRTGLYTSPHLSRMEERIRIDGRECSQAELVQAIDQIRPIVARLDERAARQVPADSGPTFFEIVTAIAFQFFAAQQADVCVLEVGLGGRLDSTNVCSPRVCVITSISLDHTKQLGSTLPAIAVEKAGIIKHGVPVVSGITDPDAAAVVERIAQERECRLLRIGKEFQCQFLPPPPEDLASADPTRLAGRIHFSSSVSGSQLKNARLGMLGGHQANNAAVAIAACCELQRQGWRIPEDAIRAGLAQTTCPARLEVISRRPDVILDAAHNDASVDAFLATLRMIQPGGKKTLLFATTSGKDYRGMLDRVVPYFDRIVFTQYSDNPRSLSVAALLKAAHLISQRTSATTRLQSIRDPLEALAEVSKQLGQHDLLAICGSFFIAGELRPLLLEKFGRPGL